MLNTLITNKTIVIVGERVQFNVFYKTEAFISNDWTILECKTIYNQSNNLEKKVVVSCLSLLITQQVWHLENANILSISRVI